VAVSSMKKLSVVTMREDTDGLLYDLQRLRCIDLQQIPTAEANGSRPSVLEEDLYTEAITRAGEAIGFLSQYHIKNRGLFGAQKEIPWDRQWPAGQELTEECLTLASQMQRNRSELASIAAGREALLPWSDYRYPLPGSKTVCTETLCGILPAGTDWENLQARMAEYACVLEKISGRAEAESAKKQKKDYAVSVTVWKEDTEAVAGVLTGFGFVQTPCKATEEEGFAAGVLAAMERREAVLQEELRAGREKAEALSERLPELEMYMDKLTTMAARAEAADKLVFTGKAAVLSGWVPVSMTDKVTELLEKRGDAYQFADPLPEEDVPVLLHNNPMASQFEPVVALYSLPAYGSFDPTWIMSFFYILIFGLMFADVGYGLLLTAGCLAGRFLMKPEGSLRKFMNMFAMCGICMIGMGVLFGGYLGDLPQAIAQNFGGRTEELDLSLWFNPLNDPMRFLVISIVLGAVHLFTGLAVQFYVLWTKGDRIAAICDAGSWMLLFLGAGVSFLSLYPGLGLVGLGLLMLICTQGRHEKNPVMKVLKGIMSLYSIVNYVSDLLSYSRILSLGLASAVIASVFNIIGTMAGPTVIGVLLLIVVGTVGHVMNLAINLLGSFVHTSRLQYIEFFGKFYEDGGRPFVPLTPRSRYFRLQ